MLLKILHYPDPRLHQVAKKIDHIDNNIKEIAANMAETMYAAEGVGLAATQVNFHSRLVVIDVSKSKDQLMVLVNPEIVTKDGKKTGEEGCLSVPGVYDSVERAETVTVRYLDLDAKEHILNANELLAVCIQHEIDHLNGIVFVQHLSRLKQSRIRTKISKAQTQN